MTTCCEVVTAALEAETRFSPLPTKTNEEKLSAARNVLASAFATITEGLLLTALLDKKASEDLRLKRIRAQFDRLQSTEKSLKMPVQSRVLPIIVERASKALLNFKPAGPGR